MIEIRKAQLADATAIAAVHVATWRTTYAGILPEKYLAGMSVVRNAAYYDGAIRSGHGVLVASASDEGFAASGPRIVGFATAGRSRTAGLALADGEIETLYVLDDWRDLGVGRGLIREAGQHLRELGCRSAYLWVLRDNPSRWFYQRLGGRPAMEAEILFAGQMVRQTAFVWDPIDRLLTASPLTS